MKDLTSFVADSGQALSANLAEAELSLKDQDISLQCSAYNYGPNLANFRWYKQVGNTDTLVFFFDIGSQSGTAGTEYENRTDFEVGPGDNVTLVINNAMMLIDEGIYYCSAQETPNPPVLSDELNITIYGELHFKIFYNILTLIL